MTRQYDIFRWYHVNECRATKGNWGEPASQYTKVAPVLCKHPDKVQEVTRRNLTHEGFISIVTSPEWRAIPSPVLSLYFVPDPNN